MEDRDGSYGSYLAFQKYEQDLEGFEKAAKELRARMVADALAEELCADPTGFLAGEGIKDPLNDPLGRTLVSLCGDLLRNSRGAKGKDGFDYGDFLGHLKERADFQAAVRKTKAFRERERKIDLEWVYALVVGRYRDGRPLVASATPNDFDYDGDRNGEKCPFHAHIRRMNPRGELGRLRLKDDDRYPQRSSAEKGRDYRVARRGMPFRQELKDGSDAHGLFFVSYQAELENVELMIDASDDNGFVQTGFDPKKWQTEVPTGMDGLIGQNAAVASQTWPRATDAGGQGVKGLAVSRYRLSHYVTHRGGGYFYAPSIAFLKEIGEYVKPT